MMPKQHKQLLLSDDLKESVVELGRITYKSSGICLYLPKRIVNCLHLDPQKNSSLVLFSAWDGCFFLIKDTELATALKPEILNRRSITLGTLERDINP